MPRRRLTFLMVVNGIIRPILMTQLIAVVWLQVTAEASTVAVAPLMVFGEFVVGMIVNPKSVVPILQKMAAPLLGSLGAP